MPRTNSGNPQQSAAPQQASSQALLDELRVAADRARDERVKLARLVKHSAELPVNGQAAADPGVANSRVSSVADQVARLEEAVAEKLEALEHAQQEVDNRTQYLESLRHTITDTTRAFVTQVEQAQHFKAHVDAAKQHVRMSAGKVVDDVRQHLSEYEAPIAERIKDLTALDEQIDKRIARMQQMHKQANEAVDQHLLGALRAAKEQAAELAEPMKQEVEQFLVAQRAKVEEAIQTKISELDVDVEVALQPLTDRFNHIILDANTQAEQLAELLPSKLDAMGDGHLDKLRDKLTEQAMQIVEGIDQVAMEKAEAAMRERVATALDDYLGKAEQDAGGYVDGLIAKLDAARAQAIERSKQELEQIEAQCQARRDETLAGLDQSLERFTQKAHAADAQCQQNREESLASFVEQTREIETELGQSLTRFEQQAFDAESACQLQRDQSLAKMDKEVDRMQALADERVAKALEIVESATDGIHAKAAAAVDSALANADKKLDAYETSAVEHLRVIDDGIEHGIENSRKRLGEYERQAQKISDEAVRIAETGIAKAQQRVAGFEAGITQRIALARQSVDEATNSVDERLARVEGDAAARVMKIVDLAETSGQAVADSIQALSDSAEKTAARAQEDLDEKLRAFESISAEALRTAEDVLRTNIGELRDSSRAMIEMVSRQVKAQANEIEPQTREVISQAEQTMRRRIAELRESAQSMVEISVNRLETQLEDVKAKAMHTAFQGIDPKQGNDAA